MSTFRNNFVPWECVIFCVWLVFCCLYWRTYSAISILILFIFFPVHSIPPLHIIRLPIESHLIKYSLALCTYHFMYRFLAIQYTKIVIFSSKNQIKQARAVYVPPENMVFLWFFLRYNICTQDYKNTTTIQKKVDFIITFVCWDVFFLSLCVLLYLCILCNIINYVAFFFVTEKNLYILAQVFSVSRPKGILYLFMPFSFFLFVSCWFKRCFR